MTDRILDMKNNFRLSTLLPYSSWYLRKKTKQKNFTLLILEVLRKLMETSQALFLSWNINASNLLYFQEKLSFFFAKQLFHPVRSSRCFPSLLLIGVTVIHKNKKLLRRRMVIITTSKFFLLMNFYALKVLLSFSCPYVT